MESIAVQKVKDLDEPARRWVQRLLGRELQDEEEVTIRVFPGHPVPPEVVRQKAAARLDRILDKAAENLKNVPDAEFEAAINEAMDHVRRWSCDVGPYGQNVRNPDPCFHRAWS
jgi:hypothetical protein